jgi:dipeptidyl aminopeptidase/acylaminoacyl peptidase
VIVFAKDGTGPLSRISAAGGDAVAVTKLLPSQTTHRFPSFLPDGKHFLYFAAEGENSSVFIGSLDSLDGQRLFTADSSAVYASQGHVLFVRQGTLLAQAFDPKQMQVTGESRPIADQIPTDVAGVGFSVSENGILEYRTGPTGSRFQLTWVDRNGKTVGTIGSPALYLSPSISPDGKQAAAHLHEGKGGDIWSVEIPGGKASRLTYDASQENAAPIWSSDGETPKPKGRMVGLEHQETVG